MPRNATTPSGLLPRLALAALLTACSSGQEEREGAATTPAGAPAAAAAPAAKIGYDLRRLRPRDGETLEAMFERLRARALSDGKRVAVLFSADWCAPCKRIEAELGSLQPAEQIADVRIFELKEEDWTEATRMDEFNALRTRWYPKTGSYPVLVLLDDDGAKIEEMKEAIERLEGDGVEPTLPNWFASSRQSTSRSG
ncbi:MAG: thioredoxin family protein [Nannocystaceae bacterium]